MRSGLDAWLVLLLAGALALSLTPLLHEPWTAAAAAGLALAVLVLLAWPCSYNLAPDRLLIRSGLRRKAIPYARMRGARPSCNPLAAPACSLRRLRIDLDRGYVLISPVDRERFPAELQARIAAAQAQPRR